MLPIFAGLMLALVTTPPPAPHPVQEWELLGSRQVSFAAERDVIPVTTREGRFTAIRLEVEGGNLHMYNVRVVFGDGSVFSPETRLNFHQGNWSRTINLPGAARVIRRVEFAYRSEGRRGRALVRIYGLQAGREAPRPAPAAVAAGPDGWERLGARVVSFQAAQGTVSAGGEGAFRRIMLVVKDADLELFNIRVVFGDGSVFSPDTRLHFAEGSRSRVIDLPGGQRVIRRIEFGYRSARGGGDGRATVEVFGS